MDFAQELKSRVDIVAVIGERVRLKKAGPNTLKGLCPFHTEKSPSFNVDAAKQFFYCFGCHKKGDVFQFIIELEGLSFYETLKELAERNGIPMPKRSQYVDDDSRLREAVLQMHELAAEHFKENLRGPGGETARGYLARRGVTPETMEHFGLGYSDRGGRTLLRLLEQSFSPPYVEKSGLVRTRDDGSSYDYFRGRLMFPIQSEMGKVIGFGGRGLAEEDVPKYLNSPKTAIYEKSKVLYNLNRAKEAIRREQPAILVEGYMDVVGVVAAGFKGVVASCGTALTSDQVRAIKRHTDKIVLNFDPDEAGDKATEEKVPLLLDEGLQVRVLELDGGLDPDEYCKKRGAEAYRHQLETAKSYFLWLTDRARAKYGHEGRVAVLKHLVPAVQSIHDDLERIQIAIQVAGYVGVDQANQGVILDAFKKSVSAKSGKPMQQPVEATRPDEKGLLNVLLSDIDGRETLVAGLRELGIAQQVAMRKIFQAVQAVHASGLPINFDNVNSRLEPDDQNMLAVAVLSADGEGNEFNLEFGWQCLNSLRRSDDLKQRQELKARIKEAERTGNLEQALGLAQELQQLERKKVQAG